MHAGPAHRRVGAGVLGEDCLCGSHGSGGRGPEGGGEAVRGRLPAEGCRASSRCVAGAAAASRAGPGPAAALVLLNLLLQVSDCARSLRGGGREMARGQAGLGRCLGTPLQPKVTRGLSQGRLPCYSHHQGQPNKVGGRPASQLCRPRPLLAAPVALMGPGNVPLGL